MPPCPYFKRDHFLFLSQQRIQTWTHEKSRRFRFMKKIKLFSWTFFAINVCIVDVKKYKIKKKEKENNKMGKYYHECFSLWTGAGRDGCIFTKRTRALLTLVFRFNKKEETKNAKTIVYAVYEWNEMITFITVEKEHCASDAEKARKILTFFETTEFLLRWSSRNFDSSPTQFKNKGCQR